MTLHLLTTLLKPEAKKIIHAGNIQKCQAMQASTLTCLKKHFLREVGKEGCWEESLLGCGGWRGKPCSQVCEDSIITTPLCLSKAPEQTQCFGSGSTKLSCLTQGQKGSNGNHIFNVFTWLHTV